MKHGVTATRPVSAWNRSIKVNFKEFFKSLFKAGAQGYAGNVAAASRDAVEAVSAVGLGKDYGGIAWLLIYRSLLQAAYTLVHENEELLLSDPTNPRVIQYKLGTPPDDPDSFTARLDFSLESSELTIDEHFFDRPADLPVVGELKKPFAQWLEGFGLSAARAASIADHLPSYFVLALNEQWRERAEEYAALRDAFDTPFIKAGAAEQAWSQYSAWLGKQVDEPMFGEAFSLRQVYVPLRAYYEEKVEDAQSERGLGSEQKVKRVVVDIETAVSAWLDKADAGDYLRVISGGPGYGKSSFTKMFAARFAGNGSRRVLFIPLHLIDPGADLIDAVGEFVRLGRILPHNPLDPEKGDSRLFIIFDGLDELAMQGKLAAETAQQFVAEVQRKAETLNSGNNPRLKVLISGRDLAVQANANVLRKPQQIFHLLPYFINEEEQKKYSDQRGLLAQDQRQTWWQLYGRATGSNYPGLPQELEREDFEEITSQPLLNYLVALSFDRKVLDLSEESNLNRIYEDLLKAVYDRRWAANPHPATAEVGEDDFIRILEEVAISAWHGDGRKTTVREIEARCEESGLKDLLDALQEGASRGVTRLLMAFYFRQAGHRAGGDRTFEFTHKSFREYLTARRLVDVVREIHDELGRPQRFRATRYNEQLALEQWIKLCGPVAMDEYVFRFVKNQMLLVDPQVVESWQHTLCRLIEYMLLNGMPMERLSPRPTFLEECQWARNAEEALLALLNSCAETTEKISKVNWPTETSFGEWYTRLQGQRRSSTNVLAMECLSYLDLAECILHVRDLFRANLSNSNLQKARLVYAQLVHARLSEANLESVDLVGANLQGANLWRANLQNAMLDDVNLEGADLVGANLRGARLERANLKGAVLDRANLEGANFRFARLRGAYLRNVKSKGVDFRDANLERADLTGTTLEEAMLDGANL